LVENFCNSPFFSKMLVKTHSTARLRKWWSLQLQVQGQERTPDGFSRFHFPLTQKPALLSCSHKVRRGGLLKRSHLVIA